MPIIPELLALAQTTGGAVLILCGLALPFLRPAWFGISTDDSKD